ncbi:hypothetical protein [Alienimonas californiensis]|uniref:Uncharacterized protein n=1 Tax=Alienimonas californiensis TaxID=2527989 RepID=A0A517P8H7_9PLAN|nr:hypothetical protein [Alienimonas californiensis]QDT15673.1 hypothetical protein CA12_17630 [Alienimonas californiensis]
MRDDDFPPLPDEAPRAPGGFRGWFWHTFLGPANAAGLGGWAGVFGPVAVLAAATAIVNGVGVGPEFFLALVCAGSGSLIVGVLVGGIGSRAVHWVERRRGERWPRWRSQFVGGFAAGVLTVIALAAVGATLANW